MATRGEWQRLINLSHELALVEDDIRDLSAKGSLWADTILFERFGVDTL